MFINSFNRKNYYVSRILLAAPIQNLFLVLDSPLKVICRGGFKNMMFRSHI